MSRDLTKLLAEVQRLRSAVQRSENDWAFIANLSDKVVLTPELRYELAQANLRVTPCRERAEILEEKWCPWCRLTEAWDAYVWEDERGT